MTANIAAAISSSQASRHSSESTEHFTPSVIVEAARATLGRIDLDPATTAAANKAIRASRFYTKADNGFNKKWKGTVFLNPPGGWCDVDGHQVIKASGGKAACSLTGECGLPPGHKHTSIDSSQKRWWQRLATLWQGGHVEAAIFVCFSVELLQSSQVERVGPLPLHFPICFPSRRVAYLNANGDVGGSPPHASCIICLTDDAATTGRFEHEFLKLGCVVVPRERASR